MTDPRIETVVYVLRDEGAQFSLADTDTVATRIVNTLDREHGGGDDTGDVEHDADTQSDVEHATNAPHDEGATS